MATDTAVAAISAIVPPVGTVYAIYKTVKFGYTVCRHLEKNDNKGVFHEIRNYVSSTVAQKVTAEHATQTARNITSVAESSGAINEVSERTGVDSSLYSRMLEGTVKTAILSGAGNLAEYVVEEIAGELQ